MIPDAKSSHVAISNKVTKNLHKPDTSFSGLVYTAIIARRVVEDFRVINSSDHNRSNYCTENTVNSHLNVTLGNKLRLCS